MAITDIDWGTVTLTNGSTAVTGSGTSWIADDIRDGDTFVFVDGGDGFQQPIVASVQSNTALTLRNAWEGPTLTATTYTLRYQWDSSRVSAMSRRLIMILDNGNIESFAALDGTGGDKGVMLIGPGATSTFPLTPFARTLLDDANAAAFWATIGATSPPLAAYRRGNILGTVSQSGGVPTGAIIEQGVNVNGEYVRFADGTLICRTSRIINTEVSASEPGLFTNGSNISFLHAANFISDANLTCAIGVERPGGSSFNVGATLETVGIGATIFRITRTGVADSTVRAYVCRVTVLGRWF